jgi:hypothetical protein
MNPRPQQAFLDLYFYTLPKGIHGGRRTFLFKSHPLHSETRVLVGVWHRAQGLASKTKLNGVWVARRNFEKPADVTTCFILSSPACASSAGPFSFKDAGTQIIVDPE